MPDLKTQISALMLQNRRTKGEHQFTLPSPDSYPYQWFWDSCFHAIILSHFDLEAGKKELLSLVAKQFENGMIPHMIYWEKSTKTDFPTIDWGKEDTSSITQPPMLAYAVWKIYKNLKSSPSDKLDDSDSRTLPSESVEGQKDPGKEFLEMMYPALKKLYNYFLTDRDPRANHLAGIINPDESGEDNSPRFDLALDLPATHSIDENYKRRLKLVDQNKICRFDAPFCMKNFFWVKDVPMNAILVENLKVLSDIATELGHEKEADLYFIHSRLTVEAMRKLMFEDGVYWSTMGADYQKIKVKTWAILAPLFGHIYTQKEAQEVIEKFLLNPAEFATPFLIPTVSKSEASFDPKGFWRGPVWFSTNWFVYQGLKKYGFDKEAKKILDSSLSLLEKSGFREQYDPLTGEGQGAKNFTWGGLIIDMLEN